MSNRSLSVVAFIFLFVSSCRTVSNSSEDSILANSKDKTSAPPIETYVGPAFDCGLGKQVGEKCTALASKLPKGISGLKYAMNAVCNAYGEAFWACTGPMGKEDTTCELCAGFGTSPVGGELGHYGAWTDVGALRCWWWTYGPNGTQKDVGSEKVEYLGGAFETPLASITGGKYFAKDTYDKNAKLETGKYFTASYNFEGKALSCGIGLIAIDPDEFINNIARIITYDKIREHGPNPKYINAGCFDGDEKNPYLVYERCVDLVGKIDSGVTSTFTRKAISCNQVKNNKCHIWSDCPDNSADYCSSQVSKCLIRSLEHCRTPVETAN